MQYDYYVLKTDYNYFIVELGTHEVTISKDLDDAKAFSSRQQVEEAVVNANKHHDFNITPCGVSYVVEEV